MAAHIVTALTEALQYSEPRQFELLGFACGHAAWGNQLELDEYSILVAMCNHATDDKLQYAVKQFIL